MLNVFVRNFDIVLKVIKVMPSSKNFISMPNNLFRRPSNTFNFECYISLSAQIILSLFQNIAL